MVTESGQTAFYSNIFISKDEEDKYKKAFIEIAKKYVKSVRKSSIREKIEYESAISLLNWNGNISID